MMDKKVNLTSIDIVKNLSKLSELVDKSKITSKRNLKLELYITKTGTRGHIVISMKELQIISKRQLSTELHIDREDMQNIKVHWGI